jgi:ABC-type dipeptide/oligopeptide/nickel transport system permease subunit
MADPFEASGAAGRLKPIAQPRGEPEPAEPAPPAPPAAQLWRDLVRSPRFVLPGVVVLMMAAMAVFPGLFAGLFGHGDPRLCDLTNSALGPRPGHPFGYDLQGCDLWSNVVYAARPSISIGVLVTAGMMLIAITLGSVSGYFGGVLDAAVGRGMDIFLGFPGLIGAIIVLQVLNRHNVWTVSLVLIALWWPAPTRIMRSTVLATRNLEYIDAARVMGAGHVKVLLRHVVPNSIAPLLALVGLYVGTIITAEAALTFLNIGLQVPAISWGVQLNTAQTYFSSHLHLLLFPSLALSVTVLSILLLGDALRDALDPKLR